MTAATAARRGGRNNPHNQKNSWPALSHTGQEKEKFAMREIDHRARRRKTLSQPKPDTTPLWTAEHPINGSECLRAELRQKKTRSVLDLRRWFKPPDGASWPTERGFAVATDHLVAIGALLEAAIAQAKDRGLLPETEGINATSHAPHRSDTDKSDVSNGDGTNGDGGVS
jgi:hypothetical protein